MVVFLISFCDRPVFGQCALSSSLTKKWKLYLGGCSNVPQALECATAK